MYHVSASKLDEKANEIKENEENEWKAPKNFVVATKQEIYWNSTSIFNKKI